MAIQYTSQVITGYNASPPPDDGSQVAANKITWVGQKSKLADPIKTLAEAINTELIAAFGENIAANVTTKSAGFSVATSDRGTLFVCDTGSYAVNLPTAATAGTGFVVGFINATNGTTVTITANGAETINGSVTYALGSQYQGIWIASNGSTWYVTAHLLPVASGSNVLAGSQVGKAVTPNGLAQMWAKLFAATATTALVIPNGGYSTISGSTTVTSLSTSDDTAGRRFFMRFSAGVTFTHNATSLILPGNADIAFQSNDMAEFISEGSGNWRMIAFRGGDDARPWPRVYNSGEQTVTASTLLQLSHGLGVIPKHVIVRARMTAATATMGFNTNDEVQNAGADGAGTSGTTIIMTATGVKLAQSANPLAVIRADTLAIANISVGSWKWVVTAYA